MRVLRRMFREGKGVDFESVFGDWYLTYIFFLGMMIDEGHFGEGGGSLSLPFHLIRIPLYTSINASCSSIVTTF